MSAKTKRILSIVVAIVIVIILAGIFPLRRALYVGTGYSAKRLCSETFLANRDPATIESVDLGFMPLPLSMSVDRQKKRATVSGLGLVSQTAVYRKGLGCALAVEMSPDDAQNRTADIPKPAGDPEGILWPQGELLPTGPAPDGVDTKKLKAAVASAFVEDDPKNLLRTRAVVVLYDGKLVAEQYAKGFDRKTPLLGWSMTKSVTNAMIGVLVRQGKLDIKKPAPIDAFANDPRAKITTDQLLRMSDGLGFDETYGAFGDATEMLYVSDSTVARAQQSPLKHKPNTHWYYSSGTTNLLSGIVRTTLKDDKLYHAFPHTEIFHPIGIRGATFEADAAGNFVGSSYLYMTARDWARFGQLYLQDGMWNGKRILPEGWVKYSCALTPHTPQGEYGAQFWLNAGNPKGSANRLYPNLPTDVCAAQGFETQRVMVFPSQKVVIVRLGLTRKRGRFNVDAFAKSILDAINPKASK